MIITCFPIFIQMEEKVKEIVEIKQRSLAEENQKTLEALKERYFLSLWRGKLCSWEFLGMLNFLKHFLQFVNWNVRVFGNISSYLLLKLLCILIHDLFILCREQSLQDQLRQAKESVSTMQKLHELAQSQLFEVRAQSGDTLDRNFNMW